AKNDAGTVNHGVQTQAGASHKFISAIANDGSSTLTQPASTDLSDLPIPVSSGGTGYAGGALAAGTFTLNPNIGTLTVTGGGSFLQIGKLCFYQFARVISSHTGAPTQFTFTFPIAPLRDTEIFLFEATNSVLNFRTILPAGTTTTFLVRDYSNVIRAPQDNDEWIAWGWFEAQ
ncbi:MAG: hypothetical protein JO051_12285, partial [Acidobacteriaceae bacterium]|nr:hypothetical protein [Acidobacteriaceae bacterium]